MACAMYGSHVNLVLVCYPLDLAVMQAIQKWSELYTHLLPPSSPFRNHGYSGVEPEDANDCEDRTGVPWDPEMRDRR